MSGNCRVGVVTIVTGRVKRRVAGVLLVGVATSAAIADAASLRCNGDLIQPGDSLLTVLDSCGQPDATERLVNEYGTQLSSALYYRGGYGRRDRKVIVTEGEVTRVEVID